MSPDLGKTADDLIERCVQELLQTTGLSITRVEDPSAITDQTVAVSVGLTSETVRAAMLLTISESLLAASRPPELRDLAADGRALIDWAGELGNQLAGRIKNRLLGHGWVLELSIPAVLRGKHLRHAARKTPLSRRLLFTHACGSLCVSLDALGIDRIEAMEGFKAPIAEGEIFLF